MPSNFIVDVRLKENDTVYAQLIIIEQWINFLLSQRDCTSHSSALHVLVFRPSLRPSFRPSLLDAFLAV